MTFVGIFFSVPKEQLFWNLIKQFLLLLFRRLLIIFGVNLVDLPVLKIWDLQSINKCLSIKRNQVVD